MDNLAEKVTAALGSGTDSKDGAGAAQGTQATAFSPLSDADVVKSVGTLFTADQKKTGMDKPRLCRKNLISDKQRYSLRAFLLECPQAYFFGNKQPISEKGYFRNRFQNIDHCIGTIVSL